LRRGLPSASPLEGRDNFAHSTHPVKLHVPAKGFHAVKKFDIAIK